MQKFCSSHEIWFLPATLILPQLTGQSPPTSESPPGGGRWKENLSAWPLHASSLKLLFTLVCISVFFTYIQVQLLVKRKKKKVKIDIAPSLFPLFYWKYSEDPSNQLFVKCNKLGSGKAWLKIQSLFLIPRMGVFWVTYCLKH